MRDIQHNRALHLSQLTNIYMEANLSKMPSRFVTLLETMFGDQTSYNFNKVGEDTASINQQNRKIKELCQEDFAVGSTKGKAYCDEILAGLARKLQHDRSVHAQKLENILDQCLKLNNLQPSSFSQMLQCMLKDNNDVDMDATWAEADKCYRLNIHPDLFLPLVV